VIFKRLFDITAAVFGLVITLPVFLAIYLLIKTQMTGSVFFKQQRVGRHGKIFKMVKFRTMTINHSGSTISVKGERRITPLGAVLRKYKLDELPELWNILIGDMSFVGPRPDVPGYADKLEGEDRLLLSIRPGLTGAASLKFSNEEELLALQDDPVMYNDEVLYPEKVRINNNYVRHMSFCLDLKIVIFTILGKKLKEDHFN